MESNLSQNNAVQLKKTNSRKATFIASIIIFSIGILISVLTDIISGNSSGTLFSAYNFGRVLGTIAFVGIIVFLIFRFQSINKRANSMLIVSIIYMLSQMGGFANNISDFKQQEATKQAFSQIITSAVSGVKTDRKTYSEEEFGTNSEFLNKASDWMNATIGKKDEFNKKVSSFNIDTYFKDEALSSKENINKSIDDVKDLKTVINDYQTASKKSLGGIEGIINELNVSEPYILSALKGYKDSISKDQGTIDEYYKIENKVCDSYIDLLSFLYSSFGNFEVKNDTCNFYEQKDVDKYNEIVESLTKTLEEEQAWMRGNEQRQKDLSQKIGDLLK